MVSTNSTSMRIIQVNRTLWGGLVGISAILVFVFFIRQNTENALFPDLYGPLTATVLPDSSDYRLDPAEFRMHGTNAIALVITDPAASWYGLASGLLAIGVPFRIVDSVDEALAHQVILIYPVLSGSTGTREELQALAAHVRGGGTLVSFAVLGGGLGQVFGFSDVLEARHRSLTFSEDPFNREFASRPEELAITLGTSDDHIDGLPAVSYAGPTLPPLAVYEDGSPAIVQNTHAAGGRTGRAVAIGIDLGHMILRAHNARLASADASYVNEYRPGMDTLLRLLAKIYREGENGAVLLSPTPHGKDVTILMTHDIDFTSSIENVPTYAALEYEAGVPATYFIQTKYVKDYNDDLFFDPSRTGVLQQLSEMGMEIASHTVSHSNEFRNMPQGSGTESYPEYYPFVQTFTNVRNASISGELRVSKFLLEALGPQTVTSFRPGHLSLPTSLPQMLEATGYRYSSSLTANEALTHLPFRTMYDRGYHAPVGVYEFPVTIEDEKGDLFARLDASIDLTRAVAQYRGVVTVLVHTESLGSKLDFVREYIGALRDEAWFGTMREYGDWWRVRESASLELIEAGVGTQRLRLSIDGRIDGLTLELPDRWSMISAPDGSVQTGRLLTLGSFEGAVDILFDTSQQ